MNAYIKTYQSATPYAKSKQPLRSRHSDVKRLFTYFVEYGTMTFGPFYSEAQAVNFLTGQGFIMDVDENGLFYYHKYKSKNQQLITDHYTKFN